MKNAITDAIRAHYDKDGFLNGFIKGALGMGAFISVAALFTGCFGI